MLGLRRLLAVRVPGAEGSARLPTLYACAEASASTFGNLPLALALLLAVRLAVPRGGGGAAPHRAHRGWRKEAGPAEGSEGPEPRPVQFAALSTSSSSGSGAGRSDRWREYVRSPVVEHAWEAFCGSVVQQVGAACGCGVRREDQGLTAGR